MIFRKTLIFICALFYSASVSAAGLDGVCQGDFFNPVSDPNWNNAFPIVIFGKAWGGSNSDNPPEMSTSTLCNCPSILLGGMNVPGINVTYWRPNKVLDISRVPGCSPSLGGTVLIPGYERNFASSGHKDNTSTRNIMEWDYDVLGVLRILEALACNKVSSISLAYDSSLDPTMNSLPSGATGESEAVTFFANLPMLLACFADTVASYVYHPLTFLPQCHGAQTPSFGFSNKRANQPGAAHNNYNHVVAHLQKQAARFQEWVTIGPTAQCVSHPFYFMMKGGYRFNRIYPFSQTGDSLYGIGDPLIAKDILPANIPFKSDGSFLVWKGVQCCLKIVP